jgi:predicted amidohydrolase YtcJ
MTSTFGRASCCAQDAAGRLADIAGLSKDIMRVPEAEIPTAVVDFTIVGGKVKYRR